MLQVKHLVVLKKPITDVINLMNGLQSSSL